MTAVRWHARDDVRVERVPLPPPPGPGEVTLAVRWCGICGTDLEEWRHGPRFIPLSPHPLTGAAAPLTLGHELAGEVVAVGPGVEGLQPGARVGCETLITCGRCVACQAGETTRCPSLAAVGLMADGGLAERCTVPAATCLPLGGVSDEAGALCETLAVGVRALHRGALVPGELVLVCGAGAVGLLAAQAARAFGARAVAVAEPLPARRELARALGAEATFAPREAPSEAYDLVLECSGTPAGARTALAATRRGGRVVLVGIYPEDAGIAFSDLGVEKSVVTTLSHRLVPDYAGALALLAEGAVRAEPVVSHRVPLGRAVRDGLEALEADPAGHLKVLVDCRHG
jgi:(R,R)-butanediol dehydrogenase/meso-butanediol dehydrogenase/diacetyl reductase